MAGADQDAKARLTIWRSICIAATDVKTKFAIRAVHGLNGVEVSSRGSVPEVPTWKLIEALSVLCLVLRCEEAKADILNLFDQMGPVEIHEDGTVRHLWAQRTLRGHRSKLSGRPDIIITASPDSPHSGNALRIIEAKCLKSIRAPTIRSEFGKAHDPRVATYLIWSFYSQSKKTIEGAKGLGIDLEVLGFDTEKRSDLISNPEVLICCQIAGGIAQHSKICAGLD